MSLTNCIAKMNSGKPVFTQRDINELSEYANRELASDPKGGIDGAAVRAVDALIQEAEAEQREVEGIIRDTLKINEDPLVGLIAQLRALSQDIKHAATAKDFMKRAIDGENVESEAGAWVNAVNADQRGESDFSLGTPESSPELILSELPDGLANFAVGDRVSESAGPIDKVELDAVVERVTASWVRPEGGEATIIVRDSIAELPVSILRSADAQNIPQDQIKGVFHNGHIYLVRENLKDAMDVESTIFHEAYGHYGARLLAGNDINKLTRDFGSVWDRIGDIEGVRKAATRFGVRKDMDGYIKAVGDSSLPLEDKKRVIIDELLAHVAMRGDFTVSENIKAYVAAVRVALRNAARAMGLERVAKALDSYTDGELLWTLKLMREAVVRGGRTTGEDALFMIGDVPPKAAAKPDVSYESEKRKVDAMIDELPEHLGKPAHWMNTNFSELMKGSGNMLWFTDYLVDSAKSVLPTAKAWFESMKARETIRIRNEERVDQIARLVDKLSQSEFNRTWNLIHDMTRNKKWAYAPTWKPDVTVDPEMALRHAALGGQEREVVDAVLKHGHDTLLETNAALTTIANDLFDEKVGRTRDPVTKHQLMKDKAQYLRVYGRKLLVSSDPYAPMRRVGTHATVGKSQLYLDTEALAKAGNKAAIDKLAELRTDDRHHKVAFSDNQYEAENVAREYRAAGLKAIASVKEVFTSSDQMPFQAFQALREMASEKDGDQSIKLMNMIDELYLESLADVSARKSELRREGTGGLKPDTMYKAFLAHGKSTAHYLSVLKTHRDVAGKFAEMRAQAHTPDAKRHDRMTVFNEMKKRFDASFNYEPAPFINKLMNLSTYWMLLTKPAYYVYNLTQPFMMTLPYMTKRHDYTAAADHMVRAYSDLLKLPKAVSFDHFDLHSLPADIRDAIVELRDMGRIDITITQDLGKRIHSGDGMASKYVARMDGFFRGMAQKTEMANRIVTAATAFRLHMEKNPNDRAGAMEYAAEVIDRTQGDYSNFNAPRLFNMNNAARLLTQFRKFQMIQVTLLVSMVKGIKNPYERAANTRALMFVLGHHALMAGAMGFPAINLIAMAFAAMGDDEEPRDLELWMKNNLGDDELGKVLRYGVPSLFNINMSGNIGMGQTFAVIPYADVDATRSGYDSLITSLAGPTFGGLGPQFWAAGGKALDGDYYGFLAGMMPGFLKSSMTAMREANEGAKTGAGDVLVSAEDIVFTDTLAKSMGFKTINDTTRQLVTGKRYEFEAFFRGKVRDIKRDYNEAYREGDGAKLEELREQWVNLQSFRRDYGFKAHPLSELMKAPAEQAKRERNTLNGVQFTNQNRGFVIDNAEEEATAE